MAKRFLFLKVRHPYSSMCRFQYLALYTGSALIQACEAAGAAIPRCIYSWSRYRSVYSQLKSRSVSATMTDWQSRATVGEHRRVIYFFISEFLMGPRMCLVEVERSPKPVASWYFTSFWLSPFVIFGRQCDARDARFEGFHEHTFGPRSKVAVPPLEFPRLP
jgi:hypothetical protein